MKSKHLPFTRLLAFSIVLTVSHGYSIAAGCASFATPGPLFWNVKYSAGATWTWTLTQSANGSVSGTAHALNSACIDKNNWTVSGTANGLGSGTFVQHDLGGLCADVTSTLALASTNDACASGQGGAYDPGIGDETINVVLSNEIGVLPTGESPSVFFDFPPSKPGLAEFIAAIVPLTYNFGGRFVSEALSSFTDGCTGGADNPVVPPPTPATNIAVAPLSQQVPAAIESQIVGDVPGETAGYTDQVGFSGPEADQLVDQIRQSGDSLPCSFTEQQTALINTLQAPNYQYSYQSNTLVITIGSDYLVFERGPPGHETSKERFFPSIAKIMSTVGATEVILNASLKH